MKPKPFIIPLFIPHRGCPYRCVFCNQTSITGTTDETLSPEQVREGVASFLSFQGDHRSPVEVAFYGGNFLGLPESYREGLLSAVGNFVARGLVNSIRFSTRPDSVTSNTLSSLAYHEVRVVEVGAQSMDDTVLTFCQRGHNVEDTCKSVMLLKTYGLRVGVQIMPGLPGDTLESILETGHRVAELEPDFVRIYPTVVVKNTVLERWYNSGRFKPLSLADAVEVTKRLYRLFKAKDISVIRMGLHASSGLLNPGNILAGPFHPAFGHLVHSAIFLDLAVQVCKSQPALPKRVLLKVHPKDVPKLTGQERGNIKRLVKQFRFQELRVLPDVTVPENSVRLDNMVA